MPTFRYTAKRGPHDVIDGNVEAENRVDVLRHLAGLGYVPVRIAEAGEAQEGVVQAPRIQPRRVPHAHLAIFTRQFASLVRARIPLLRALTILEEQTKHPYFRYVLGELFAAIRQGETLSGAMAGFPKVFRPLYVNLIRSGETSGTLDEVLEHLTQQAEHEEAMRARIRAAFTYPIFVGAVGCLTVVFLMTFVMPRLSRLLEGLGERLPLATRLLLAGAEAFTQWEFWAIILGLGLVIGLLWRGFGARGRRLGDSLVLRLPIIGPLTQQLELAQFARSFGLQLNNGIPILQAVEVAISLVSNEVIRSSLEHVPQGLQQGSALSDCLKAQPVVGTPLLVNAIVVGEEGGTVGEALMEVAAYYEREAERLLQTLAALLEPALIVGVGLVVGFIVIAVLLPIFEMSGM